MKMTADISDCGHYRYDLTRVWDENKEFCVFIGLNPSTADAEQDDPTIRRCIRFAQDWGFGTLVMLNIFPYRSTDPKALKGLSLAELYGDDLPRYGRKNHEAIINATADAGKIIAAWGTNPRAKSAERSLFAVMREARVCRRFECLGLTADGSPRHPLYVAAHFEPVLFQETP